VRYLGAHVSAAGGLANAFERAGGLGCTAFQIFVKSPNRWHGRALDETEAAAFGAARGVFGAAPLVAHAAYLINLAAADPVVAERSRAGLADELARCRRLGLEGLVLHPGAHGGDGEEAGIARVAAALDATLAAAPAGPTRVLLEVTAGQGTTLGHRLEHLEAILAATRHEAEVGICLDTCHLFAAGYPIHTAAGLDDLLADVRRRFGPGRLGAFHLNDSKQPLGSRRDRHANIGEGHIGAEPFGRLLRHPDLAEVPLLLETPAGDDLAEHRRDLARLREAAAAQDRLG
jgi:deoxyribonuclease IV